MDTPLPPMNPEVARLRRQSAQRKYRKRLRHVRFLWTVAGAFFLLLFIEVLIALSFSPRFWIYRIDVQGQESLTKRQIIKLLNVPEHSNFYRISLHGLEKRLMSEQRVASATVRHGRIGTLVVTVHERQAVCQLGYSIPTLYADATGHVFTRPIPPATQVPVVEGISIRSPKRMLGKRLNTIQMKTVLNCFAALQKASGSIGLDISRIVVAPNGWINLVLRQGTLIYIGQPVELATKVWCIKMAIVQASKEGHTLEQLDYINVRSVNTETGVGLTFHVKDSQEGGQEETTQP